jgi:hypothetical protein
VDTATSESRCTALTPAGEPITGTGAAGFIARPAVEAAPGGEAAARETGTARRGPVAVVETREPNPNGAFAAEAAAGAAVAVRAPNLAVADAGAGTTREAATGRATVRAGVKVPVVVGATATAAPTVRRSEADWAAATDALVAPLRAGDAVEAECNGGLTSGGRTRTIGWATVVATAGLRTTAGVAEAVDNPAGRLLAEERAAAEAAPTVPVRRGMAVEAGWDDDDAAATVGLLNGRATVDPNPGRKVDVEVAPVAGAFIPAVSLLAPAAILVASAGRVSEGRGPGAGEAAARRRAVVVEVAAPARVTATDEARPASAAAGVTALGPARTPAAGRLTLGLPKDAEARVAAVCDVPAAMDRARAARSE